MIAAKADKHTDKRKKTHTYTRNVDKLTSAPPIYTLNYTNAYMLRFPINI